MVALDAQPRLLFLFAKRLQLTALPPKRIIHFGKRLRQEISEWLGISCLDRGDLDRPNARWRHPVLDSLLCTATGGEVTSVSPTPAQHRDVLALRAAITRGDIIVGEWQRCRNPNLLEDQR